MTSIAASRAGEVLRNNPSYPAGPGIPANQQSRLILFLRPFQPTLHLSFTDIDISRVCACLGPLTAVRTFHHPAIPGPVPSIAVAVADFASPYAANAGLTELSNLVVPGVGTLEVVVVPAGDEGAVEEQVTLKYMGLRAGPAMDASEAPALKELASFLAQPGEGDLPYFMSRLELVNLFGCESFNVTESVLGDHDRNIHYILEHSDNKVSISLKGIPANDAPIADRLHMAVQSTSESHYENAVAMAEDLLQAVCHQYVQACVARRQSVPNNVGFIRHMYLGVRGKAGQGERFKYLGQQERPKVWLDKVATEAPYQRQPAGGPNALGGPNTNQPGAGGGNQPTVPGGSVPVMIPTKRHPSGGGWGGQQSKRGAGRGRMGGGFQENY